MRRRPPTPTRTAHSFPSPRPFRPAAGTGVDCGLLAEAGTVSAPTIIEGRAGLLAGYGALDRAAALTAGLGREFHILDVIHKPAPACVFVQKIGRAHV